MESGPGEPSNQFVRNRLKVFDPMHTGRSARRQGFEGIQDLRPHRRRRSRASPWDARDRRSTAPRGRILPAGARTAPPIHRRIGLEQPCRAVVNGAVDEQLDARNRPAAPARAARSASPCQSRSLLPGMHHGEIRRRSGSPPSVPSSSARYSSRESSLQSITCAPVSPDRENCVRSSANLAFRSWKDSVGITRATSSMAAASSRSPVGLPLASQTTSAAWSKERGPVTPAISRARELAKAECPSKRRMRHGSSERRRQSARGGRRWIRTHSVQAQPRTHPPGTCCCGLGPQKRPHGGEVRGAGQVAAAGQFQSKNGAACRNRLSPGVSTASPKSMTSAAAHSAASARLPVAVITPSRTATACGAGRVVGWPVLSCGWCRRG